MQLSRERETAQDMVINGSRALYIEEYDDIMPDTDSISCG